MTKVIKYKSDDIFDVVKHGMQPSRYSLVSNNGWDNHRQMSDLYKTFYGDLNLIPALNGRYMKVSEFESWSHRIVPDCHKISFKDQLIIKQNRLTCEIDVEDYFDYDISGEWVLVTDLNNLMQERYRDHDYMNSAFVDRCIFCGRKDRGGVTPVAEISGYGYVSKYHRGGEMFINSNVTVYDHAYHDNKCPETCNDHALKINWKMPYHNVW